MKFYNKLLFLTLIILPLFYGAIAQHDAIKGKVIDAGGHPIENANIYFKDFSESGRYGLAFSASDGTYVIERPKIHCTKIVCERIGFAPLTIINIGDDNRFSFVLNKQIESLPIIAVVGTHKYSKEELREKKKEALAKKLAKRTTQQPEIAIIEPTRIVAQRATFIHDDDYSGFQDYLSKSIVYPDSATISDVKGTVRVGFTIDKNGKQKEVTLVKGVNKYADDLVLNAIINMPVWHPARQNGALVEEYKEVSVSFDITGVKK